MGIESKFFEYNEWEECGDWGIQFYNCVLTSDINDELVKGFCVDTIYINFETGVMEFYMTDYDNCDIEEDYEDDLIFKCELEFNIIKG